MKFKAGDVVQLKSGGPLMTVSAALSSMEAVTCVWFDEQQHVMRDGFPQDILKAAEDPDAQ